ncbi:tumor necrosis factor receptor superfamily member 1B isoform X1 [Pantherophis guttatus]|uniref:Tumor necrosis factor receptor superfamily member 1B isoform X1 n=1 Tax=Pantherophis guttatus TaxID=94885 RepID=A0ABM3YX83_PANGU|nr:tumor necrosis factor receptor superfamily member 1B isoform X1 [Pantherophis guttatus]
MKTHRYLYAALACWALEILCLQAQGLPYTPSQGSRCLNPREEYYEENIQKCCRSCPPGFRVQQKCDNGVNTQCVRCAEGSYNTGWSRAGRCFSCSPQCKEGFVEEKTCTHTQNRVCWCRPDHFCSLVVSDKCYHCQPYQKCAMGYGVLREGTRETDVECALCQPGTFSDHESHQSFCTPHRICQSPLVLGNSTHNTVCGNPGGQVDPATTSTQLTTSTKRLRWHVGTERPTFNKQDPSAQTGRIVGMTAIPVVLAALICFVVFRKSGQKCVPLWEEQKQPFSPAEKFPGKWPQEPTAVGQEKDSLLRMSPSSFWDSPEKRSETNDGDPPKVETDDVQQRSLNDRTCYSAEDSTGIVGNGKTHVNVSCVVSICNGGHSPALKPRGRPKPDTSQTLPSHRKKPPREESPAGQLRWRWKTVWTSWTPAGENPSRLASKTPA